MSNYTRTFTVVEEFEGDKITVELKRLTRTAMLEMLPHLKVDGGGRVEMNMSELILFVGVVADIVKPFVKSLKGLIVEGRQVSPEVDQELFDEVYESAMYTPLWGKVALKLMQESSVKQNEDIDLEKKSEELSNESFKEAEAMTGSEPEGGEVKSG